MQLSHVSMTVSYVTVLYGGVWGRYPSRLLSTREPVPAPVSLNNLKGLKYFYTKVKARNWP